MSSARLEHLIIGLVCLGAYVYLKQQRESRLFASPLMLLVTLPVLYLGTALPDWDITLLGIGRHRHPLFHSSLPYFCLAWLWRKLKLPDLIARLAGPRSELALHVALALGLASHLLWDTWDYGDVRWIPGGTLDRLWLGGHACLLIGLCWWPSLLLPVPAAARESL